MSGKLYICPTKYHINLCLNAKENTRAAWVNLSAKGSINFPSSVIILKFLAM